MCGEGEMKLLPEAEPRVAQAREQIRDGPVQEEREVLSGLAKSLQSKRGEECRPAAINANGLRGPTRRDDLAAVMLDFYNDACVATETHLRST